MTAFFVIAAGILLIGPPFTLWWWKVGDKWADAEHKRFKPKAEDSSVERVVVKKNN